MIDFIWALTNEIVQREVDQGNNDRSAIKIGLNTRFVCDNLVRICVAADVKAHAEQVTGDCLFDTKDADLSLG